MARDWLWDVLFLLRKQDGVAGRKGGKDVNGSTYEALSWKGFTGNALYDSGTLLVVRFHTCW